MCAVSVVIDQYQRTFPHEHQYWGSRLNYNEFFRLLEIAKKKDIEDGKEDCSPPGKQDYLKRIMEMLDSIEVGE